MRLFLDLCEKEETLMTRNVSILNMTKIDSLDDNKNIGINKPDLKRTRVIKSKIKNISKIIIELKKFK